MEALIVLGEGRCTHEVMIWPTEDGFDEMIGLALCHEARRVHSLRLMIRLWNMRFDV